MSDDKHIGDDPRLPRVDISDDLQECHISDPDRLPGVKISDDPQ